MPMWRQFEGTWGSFFRPTLCFSSLSLKQRSMLNFFERSGWIKNLWHRNFTVTMKMAINQIEQSNDQPVLKLLHNIAHAGLEIPSTSPYHRKSDLLASFKIKTGRNSTVLGHFKGSESWTLRILRETIAYFPSLYSIYATFSIGFHNGLYIARWYITCYITCLYNMLHNMLYSRWLYTSSKVLYNMLYNLSISHVI